MIPFEARVDLGSVEEIDTRQLFARIKEGKVTNFDGLRSFLFGRNETKRMSPLTTLS
jgi:hypothetical protein